MAGMLQWLLAGAQRFAIVGISGDDSGTAAGKGESST